MRQSIVFSVSVALLLAAASVWAEKGIVEITSEPGGAKVYLDGQRKGTTPSQPGKALVLELEEGEYKLEGKKDESNAVFDLYVPAGGIQPAHLVFQLPMIHARYQNNLNGTVTDIQTNLMWMRCSVGQTWNGETCTDEAEEFTWKRAKKLTANFAGYSDWRISMIEELRTLVYCSSGKPDYFNPDAVNDPDDFDCEGEYQKPTIVQAAFPNTPDTWFWSGSPRANYSDYAWYVNFSNGNAYDSTRGNDLHVRLVRGGQ
jgi:hypothetical protein